ncbi:hypothetical protein NDU88_000009 [Pleurodeles waltl]|uniref:Uncharacterized protein n=1 Tax=Pleurodeles waltl TaxID=8319 RepID=A0AAV7KP70_PLEWA|nr:hypothetical protein NDU88_000009 [Pleurodeles waltl]
MKGLGTQRRLLPPMPGTDGGAEVMSPIRCWCWLCCRQPGSAMGVHEPQEAEPGIYRHSLLVLALPPLTRKWTSAARLPLPPPAVSNPSEELINTKRGEGKKQE